MPAVEAAAAASAAKADDHAPGSVQAKAQVLVSSGPPVFALRDVALSPTDGSCTLRMLGASICASDLHTAEGRRPAVPSQPDAECTLGHEGVGVVLGADPPTLASGVQVGDTVTFSVASSSCAPTCGRCEVGLPQKCVKLFKYGHEAYRPQAELSGTYGSHMVLQEGSTVVPICRKGEELPASLALCCMMNCSGATAVASARSCGSIENRRVAVFGGGPLGLLIALRAKDLGAKEAAVIDLSPKVIESVKRFGLETELTGEYDAVVEACGAKAVLGPAIKALRVGGTLVLVGLVHPNSDLAGITAETIIRKCLTIVGVHNYTPTDLRNTVPFVSRAWAQHKSAFEGCGLGESAPQFPLSDIAPAVDTARKTIGRVLLVPE